MKKSEVTPIFREAKFADIVKDTQFEEGKAHTEAVRAAEPAYGTDLEVELAELARLQARRRKDPVLERTYEAQRAVCADLLREQGNRLFLDEHGIKTVAFLVEPEPVDVSVAALEEMELDGDIDYDLLEEIAPRKVDKTAFHRAVATGRLEAKQVAKVAKIGKGTPWVRMDPLRDEEMDDD